MKNIALLFITACSLSITAQDNNYIKAFEQFKTNYNTEAYSEIFEKFSSDMQAALPLENTKQFFGGLQAQVGKIQSAELVSQEKSSGAQYKTEFERATLGVYLTLDNQNKIAGLLIKPYEAPNTIKAAVTNALLDYPEAFAKTIFEKVKNMPNNSQLSIGVIRNGHAKYYGTKRQDSSISPSENQNKLFEIGSISKVFTSTVLAALVENQTLKLEDKINSQYDFDFKDQHKISYENLANHTSGLSRLPSNLDVSDTTNPYKSYGKVEIETYLKDMLTLEQETANTYNYSNLGSGLLGYTLGIQQGTTFQKLLQKTVFQKYDMTHSYTSTENLGTALVQGMDSEGNLVSNWDFDVLFGGGGIISTTEDLGKFALAQFNREHKELALTRESTFKANENLSLGLGWHIMKSKQGDDLYWHNGGTGGYTSSMIVDIEAETAIIILCNVAGASEKIDDLGFELLEVVKSR